MCVYLQYFFCVIVDKVQWWFNVPYSMAFWGGAGPSSIQGAEGVLSRGALEGCVSQGDSPP